jgi:parvulin-like peptidyl-prolyl isomerase
MKTHFWVLALLMISCLAGCGGSRDKLEDKTVLAKIGDRILTAEDMETEIPEEYKSSVTLEQKKKYVGQWIRSEILYEMAIKQKVDKKLNFLIEQSKKDVVINKFLEENLKDIGVTPEEISTFYNSNKDNFKRSWDEVRVSHILLLKKEDAQRALKRIESGEDFAKVAKDMTEDQNTRMQGGDLGYFGALEVSPQIAQMAFTLPIGKVSPIIQTEQGFDIIKVFDKKPKGSLRDLEEVKSQIGLILLNKKRTERIEKMVEEGKSNLKIERFNWAKE